MMRTPKDQHSRPPRPRRPPAAPTPVAWATPSPEAIEGDVHNAAEGTNKKAGQVVSTVSIVVAKDGKTMSVTTKGKNDKGPFTNVAVFDRQ